VKKVDISVILASSIHESKNAVGNLMYQLQTLKSEFDGPIEQVEKINNIEEGLKQLNDEWVEYLYLFKLASDGYDLQTDTLQVSEFLDDQVFVLSQSATARHLILSYECDESLLANFDERLLTSVISTGVYNALRFAKSKILLKAEVVDNYLVFQIEDDGPGFSDTNNEEENFLDSSTGLGLYFTELSAQAHSNNGKEGYITKTDSSSLNGACLSIYIPQ
jgi:K+-sensing histidine kinase KdpD